MQFTKSDLIQAENLIKALKKAKFDLDGMEVLAFAELFKWASKLFYVIQAEVAQGDVSTKPVVDPIAATPPTSPKPPNKAKIRPSKRPRSKKG